MFGVHEYIHIVLGFLGSTDFSYVPCLLFISKYSHFVIAPFSKME